MPDPNPILLLYRLRFVLDSLNGYPELDQRFSGIEKLKSAIREEIEELEPEVQLVIQQMPEPSVGVPA